jgi:hypothetical protein
MKGRSLALSPARRFIADLSWLANRVPIGVIRRTINVKNVRDARKAAITPIPWTILFAKAYALVAKDCPPLRQTYATLPWPHLYEVEQSVASIIIERDWDGSPGLFPAKIKNIAEKSLDAIAAELNLALTAPVRDHKPFRTLLRVNRLPLLIRRFLWWFAFNAGPQRHKFFGTFGMSVLGHMNTSVNYPVSPVTTFITYGPFQPDGTVEVTMGFDHRTMDGAIVAQAMGLVEEALNGVISDELRGLKNTNMGT